MNTKAVIIGAGFGGLALANLLAKAGYRVEVYEKLATAGGRAGILEIDGFTFDTGPSWYLMPEVYEHYFQLLNEKISGYIDLIKLDPAYKVFFENAQPITIQADLMKNKRTFEKIEKGAGQALQEYLGSAEEIYHLAMENFLYDNVSAFSMLRPINLSKARPMISAITTPLDRYVKKYFKNQRLQQIMEYTMVFLGTSPFEAPSLYRLMSHLDFNQGVYYPKGGMYTIVQALVSIGQKLGVKYNYSSPVRKILTRGVNASGIELLSGRKINADIVISNADLHYTETALLQKELQSYPENYWAKKKVGPSALLMYLGIEGQLPELSHHNLFFVDNWQANFNSIYTGHEWPQPGSIYVSKTTASDFKMAPKGCENLFILVPGPSGISTMTDIEVLSDIYLEQLELMSGIKNLRKRIMVKKLYSPQDFADDFNSWKGTALGLSHVLSQSAFLRPNNYSRKVKGLYYVGANTVPGIGLPMCLIGAELTFKRISAPRIRGPLKDIKTYG